MLHSFTFWLLERKQARTDFSHASAKARGYGQRFTSRVSLELSRTILMSSGRLEDDRSGGVKPN